MKAPFQFGMSVLLGFWFMGACARLSAQSNIAIGFSAPTNTIPVNGSLTYTIFMTNQTPAILDVFVTNAWSGPAQLLGANATLPGFVISTNATSAIFEISPFFIGNVVQLTASVRATDAGFITNAVTVGAPAVSTNIFSTNKVNQVTNTTATVQDDLGVSIAGPFETVITNDYVTYGITASNLGPSSVSGVAVSSPLPPGVKLIGASPTSPAPQISNNIVRFSLGTLTNLESRSFALQVQPVNAGVLTFSASIGAENLVDPNPTNNTASTEITVTNYLSGLLIATAISAMTYDPQTGLMEQTILLSNLGSNTVASARVVGLSTTNWLFNAVGTNDGNPFVVYGASLAPGQSVDLVLEYFVTTRLPISATNYAAFEVPPPNLAPPVGTNAPFLITLFTNLPSGNTLIEFQSIPNRSYTILYGPEATLSSNVLAAQPSIAAPADRTQWIDAGPPKTVAHPTNASARFYRVQLNP